MFYFRHMTYARCCSRGICSGRAAGLDDVQRFPLTHIILDSVIKGMIYTTLNILIVMYVLEDCHITAF